MSGLVTSSVGMLGRRGEIAIKELHTIAGIKTDGQGIKTASGINLLSSYLSAVVGLLCPENGSKSSPATS